MQEYKALDCEKNIKYRNKEIMQRETGDRLKKCVDDLDKNRKVLEGMIATTIAQTMVQTIDAPVLNTIMRHLTASRNQLVAIRQPEVPLAQVPSVSQVVGNNVSTQPSRSITRMVVG